MAKLILITLINEQVEVTLSLVNRSLCSLDMLSLPVQFERGVLVYIEDLSRARRGTCAGKCKVDSSKRIKSVRCTF